MNDRHPDRELWCLVECKYLQKKLGGVIEWELETYRFKGHIIHGFVNIYEFMRDELAKKDDNQ